MSFSSEVKEELSKTATLANKDAVKAELIGYIITGNVTLNGKSVNFSTESEYNINRFSKLLNNLNIMNYSIGIQGKIYTISAKTTDVKKNFRAVDDTTSLNSFLEDILKQEVLKKALVRGAFLGGGSINNPENKYHVEISFRQEKEAMIICNILQGYQIQFKLLKKSKGYSLYSKEGGTIANILAFMGASSSVLRFEEIRVMRDMRNNVNRMVNCETANLNKTINAALKQIEDIKLIKKMNRFENLSENLKEIATLRLENPEASLVELGNMLKVPVGKSGVNHRLKVISQIADELRVEL
jgi:DNA-binding protein WhiA